MARARGLSAVAAILIAAAANAAQPFGLISPERAEQLRDLPRSSAIAIIQSADAASARAPHPLPVVHTEGTLPHQGIYDESVPSRADLYAMRDLAIAYRITRQIAFNLCADGSTFDFEVRDALHYVTYDLEPLAIAALAAREHGEDWVTPRLTAAVDWLLPYARGEKTHVVHFEIVWPPDIDAH